MRKSILIVDDEPKVLQAIHRMLKGMEDKWLVAFAECGAQALQMMALQPFDVVVSDLVMPGMDGAQLLSEVMQRYPQCTRIVLCWNADQPQLSQLYGIAHQYLFKPCDAATLDNMLSNLFSRSEVLKDQKVKKVIAQVKTIPSLPTLYLDLQREMQSENASLETAAEIVSRDPGMTSKLLQLVNSAYFGLARKITSPNEAVLYLGVETIKSIVLSLQLFSFFDRSRIAVGALLDDRRAGQTAVFRRMPRRANGGPILHGRFAARYWQDGARGQPARTVSRLGAYGAAQGHFGGGSRAGHVWLRPRGSGRLPFRPMGVAGSHR
jgi:DNA-binding NarL/FixJ family response regulator